MLRKIFVAGAMAALLVGCQSTNSGFGGSGGSWQGSGGFGGSGGSGQVGVGVGLGRDACTQEARRQGLDIARIDSAQEYGGSPARGVQVRMQVRRSAVSVNTEPRVCRFSYSSGQADISRT
jgi:hypothetical protein